MRQILEIEDHVAVPPMLYADFRERRLNLYFDDVVEGPGAATPADIEALASFGREWLAEERKHPRLWVFRSIYYRPQISYRRD
jgi:hypothetical protein